MQAILTDMVEAFVQEPSDGEGICCNKVRLRCGSGEPLELEVDERLHVGGDELVGEQDGCGCGEDDQRQRHGGIRCDRVAERERPLSNHVTSTQ